MSLIDALKRWSVSAGLSGTNAAGAPALTDRGLLAGYLLAGLGSAINPTGVGGRLGGIVAPLYQNQAYSKRVSEISDAIRKQRMDDIAKVAELLAGGDTLATLPVGATSSVSSTSGATTGTQQGSIIPDMTQESLSHPLLPLLWMLREQRRG